MQGLGSNVTMTIMKTSPQTCFDDPGLWKGGGVSRINDGGGGRTR